MTFEMRTIAEFEAWIPGPELLTLLSATLTFDVDASARIPPPVMLAASMSSGDLHARVAGGMNGHAVAHQRAVHDGDPVAAASAGVDVNTPAITLFWICESTTSK